jgi:hypothetical protein
MTYSKKQWMMLILGAGVLFLVYWFFFRNKLKENKESSYDENLMIFGNENGYTNYQLDGGSLESSYGPDFGAYGSYGNESSYQDTYIKSAKTPCKKGYYQVPGDKYTWCVKDDAIANPMGGGNGSMSRPGGPGKPTPTPTYPGSPF